MPAWTRTLLAVLLAARPGHAQEPTRTDGAELGITIMGAIVQKSSEENVALIKEQGGTVKAVKRDHVILGKYQVLAVHDGQIEIQDRQGKRWLVHSDKFAGALSPKKEAPAAGAPTFAGVAEHYREEGFERVRGKITMTGMYRDKLIREDLAKILMQATAEPYMENGQIAGFKMSQIDEDSIYAKAGIANGDIIVGINGQDLSSVAGTIQLLHSLKGADAVEVDLRRGDQTIKITADVK